jgi:hypothetical protein
MPPDVDVFYDNFGLAYGEGEGKPPALPAAGEHSQAWNVNNGGNGVPDPGAIPYAKTFTESMFVTYTNSIKRHEIVSGLKHFVGEQMDFATTDIGPLLISTLSQRVPFIINRETQLLNMMDAAPGQMLFVDDWMYRCRKINQGATRASRVNLEAPLSTTSHVVTFAQQLNILSFWGDPISLTFVARAQNRGQNTGLDLLKLLADAEMQAIRKAINNDAWNGVIQPNFVPPNVTEMGGLIGRIETNIVSNGNIDLAAADIEEVLDDVSYQIGDKQCALFVNRDEVGSVRVIETNRYGGNNPRVFADYNNELAAKFTQYKIAYDRIYDPDVGGFALPVIHDRDLPSGTQVLMSIEPEFTPKFAHFVIDGQIGPWMWVRPVYDANETVFIADGGTMDDAGEETRAIILNGGAGTYAGP